MASSLTIRQAKLVLPDRVVTGDLVVEDGIITSISPRATHPCGEVIQGAGLTVLPGLIDGHVNFRDPGWPEVETMHSGSCAAAAGGVTSFLDMPHNRPNTCDLETLHHKLQVASENSLVNFGFYLEGTNENIDSLLSNTPTSGVVICPTNFGVEELGDAALENVFASTNLPIAFVSEDPVRLRERKILYPDTREVSDHSRIFDPRTASDAMQYALALARKHGSPIHFLQVSSEEEVSLLQRHHSTLISGAISIQHLALDAGDAYERLGSHAQTLPPLRTARHHHALWTLLTQEHRVCLTSGHLPVSLQRKNAAYPTSESGMPAIEWWLSLCLHFVHEERMTLSDVARLCCDLPAQIHGIPRKGRLEVGFDGDLVLVDCAAQREVHPESFQTACGWSPWEEQTLVGWPVMTIVRGCPVYRDGEIINGQRGRPLQFVR